MSNTKCVLLSYSQGSGKSTSIVVNSIIRAAKAGKSCLLAVPRGDIATEYKKNFAAQGVDCFILASHEAYFNPEKPNRLSSTDCLYYDEIQELHKIGVSSSTYKEEFCAKCPFLNSCYYPLQYKEVMEPKHKVVIIQHAHFSCQEVIYELAKKRFDALFIDESFIESIYKQVEIPQSHIKLLGEFGYDWTDELSNWLSGLLDPQTAIDPDPDELREVKEKFDKEQLQYIIPDYIRFYNSKRTVNDKGRIEVVYELPFAPVTVLTDATPPIDLIKRLTGIDNIEVYGANKIVDITQVHPDNEIVQVLNYTSGAKRLNDDDELHPILDRIAKEIELLEDDQKCVITAYLKDHKRIQNYLADRYPSLVSKVTLTGLSKGVNTFATYDLQIILASRFLLGRDYLLQTYIYKQVANFYRKRKGEVPLKNPFPRDLSAKVEVKGIWQPVRRAIKISNTLAGVYEFEDFRQKVPLSTSDVMDDQYWYKLIYDYAVGEIQQAIRLRFKPDKPRRVFILTNLSLPSTLITRSVEFNNWLEEE